MWQVKVFVSPKEGVLDPQGAAVESALKSLEYKNARKVRIGKYITLQVDLADKTAAEAEVKEMCQKLLTNPIIESYTFEIKEA
jgi:phosphoribosylformylglycinamidine synthase PurS subunit